MARNNNFNLVDFYNSLEQNYKQSPEGEAKLHGKGDILDPLVKMLFSSGSADTAMAPAMQNNSMYPEIPIPRRYQDNFNPPTGQGIIEFNAHDEINKLISQNDTVNTLKDYLSEEFGGVQSISPNKMLR